MSDLTKPRAEEIPELLARAAHYGQSVVADGTLRGYRSEFGIFRRWAEERGLPAFPTTVDTVAVFLAALADGMVEVRWTDRGGHPRVRKEPFKYASIQHYYQAIIFAHRSAGHDWPSADPAITKVLRGIRYRKGTKRKRVQPLELNDLRACLAKMRERRFEDLTIIRDRAVLSLGFFSAMRRSEIVGLKVEDLEFSEEGLTINIRKSKDDQFSEGQQVGIRPQQDPDVCPIALLKRYLEISELKSGPLFRRIDARSDCLGPRALTAPVVATIVKTYAERAGYDPERFAGHSLRTGFVTTAAAKGVTLHNIMRQTRHKSERVALTYIRPATVFRNNPTDGLSDDAGTCRHNWVNLGRSRWCPKCDHREPSGEV